jgi:hypothetical protein
MPAIIFSQSQYRFFINNINMPIDNKGILAAVNIPPDGTLGRFDSVGFLFSGGFLLSGYAGDSLWANGVATASLIENYIPGNVDSNQYDPRYDLYVNDNYPYTVNYLEWNRYKFAVGNGADFYDGDGNGIYDPIDLNGNNRWDPNEDRPDIIGDKTAWCVYNDGQLNRVRFPNTEPLGIEIHQSVFAYQSYNAPQLQNVLFIRYKIINTGKANSRLDSVYFSAWADPDLGIHEDDLVGCDTLSNSGFLYNDSTDYLYGENPPAFFINILQGPKAYIPGETFIDNNSNQIYDQGIDTPLDTAYNRAGELKGIEIYPGAKNQNLTSFTRYIMSDPIAGDPSNEFETRNYLQGRKKLGDIFNPCDIDYWGSVFGGINCNDINPLFWYSGDPETQVGWLNTRGSDYRILVNTGPFDLYENDPVTIIVAYTIGRGNSPENSVTVGKLQSQFVQQFYQSNFDDNLVSVEDEIVNIPSEFILHQNYPNPFNPVTTIKYSIPNVTLSSSSRAESRDEGSRVQLKVYDVLGNEVVTLVDEYKPAGIYNVQFTMNNLSSGIYFYQLKAGEFIQTKKMILIK